MVTPFTEDEQKLFANVGKELRKLEDKRLGQIRRTTEIVKSRLSEATTSEDKKMLSDMLKKYYPESMERAFLVRRLKGKV